MELKSKFQKILEGLDWRTASSMEFGRENIKEWLQLYTRLAGLALIIGILVCAWLQEWLFLIVLACTLHIQIVFRYSFRTLIKEELWPIQEQPKNSEPGLKAQQN
jgi:hypothetical protein